MATRLTLERFAPHTNYDAMNMLLGMELGQGSARQVFVNDLNPQQVVKVEGGASSFQNVQEWQVWKILEQTESPLMDFFAPCRFISPDGRLLVMDRTEQPRHYPYWVPKVFSDLKLTNFGMLNGRFVCHDYGMLMLEFGLKMQFVKAEWWQTDTVPALQ